MGKSCLFESRPTTAATLKYMLLWLSCSVVFQQPLPICSLTLSTIPTSNYSPKLTPCIQSHYREVVRWRIFMEQKLRFWQSLGSTKLHKIPVQIDRRIGKLKVFTTWICASQIFWILFKTVHCQGPCNLRSCISRPYCTHILKKVNACTLFQL